MVVDTFGLGLSGRRRRTVAQGKPLGPAVGGQIRLAVVRSSSTVSVALGGHFRRPGSPGCEGGRASPRRRRSARPMLLLPGAGASSPRSPARRAGSPRPRSARTRAAPTPGLSSGSTPGSPAASSPTAAWPRTWPSCSRRAAPPRTPRWPSPPRGCAPSSRAIRIRPARPPGACWPGSGGGARTAAAVRAQRTGFKLERPPRWLDDERFGSGAVDRAFVSGQSHAISGLTVGTEIRTAGGPASQPWTPPAGMPRGRRGKQ